MTQPSRPTVPPQPAALLKPPPPAKRVNLGIRSILNRLSDPSVAPRSAKAAADPEIQKRREKIARLAKQLREELDELSRLEKAADDK